MTGRTLGERFVVAVTAVAGLFILATGVWSFIWPANFYDQIALFPPYNRHFLHDVGAFQIGLGATLLLALRWRDSLFVALLGVGLGAGLHTIAHVIDRDLGGRALDPLSLGLLAILVLIAAGVRWSTIHAAR